MTIQGEPLGGGLSSGSKVAAFVKRRFGGEVWPHTGWPWLKDLGSGSSSPARNTRGRRLPVRPPLDSLTVRIAG